ncbi:MAG: hypothetical protein ABIE94_00130 [archaeon]
MTRIALATAAALLLLASATQADSQLILPADHSIVPVSGFTQAFELPKLPHKSAAERSRNQEIYSQEALRNQNRDGYTVILYWEPDQSGIYPGNPKLAAETYAMNFNGNTVVAPVATKDEYLGFILDPSEPIQNHAYFGPAGMDALWFSSTLAEGTYLETEDLEALTGDLSACFTDDASVRFYGRHTGADNIPGPEERRCFADVYAETFGVETHAPCSDLEFEELVGEGASLGIYRLQVPEDRIDSLGMMRPEFFCSGNPSWIVYGANSPE